MTACQIVPFPSVRRIGYIRKLARLMAHYSADGGERTLNAQLNAQYTAMLRRGLPPEVVERELRAFELAVRAQLWAIVMQGGDAA
jgi:hypothetical protein